MLDPQGQVRARFGLSSDGSAGLAIGDDNGKVRATLGLSTDGSASLAFGDRNGKIRAKFGLASDASPTLGAHVEGDEVTHRYTLADQGSPTLGSIRPRGAGTRSGWVSPPRDSPSSGCWTPRASSARWSAWPMMGAR